MLPVSPQRVLENAKWPLYVKKCICHEKVYYKVSLGENRQRHSCKTFSGLSIRAEVVAGGRPLLPENLAERNPSSSKMPISNRYSLIATQP